MTGNASGSDRILGSLRSQEGTGVVRMEDRFSTGIDDLWSALTDPRRLARWIAEVDGDLRPGGDFGARYLDGALTVTGHVDACEPPHRLAVTMRDTDPHPGQPEETVIEMTLSADGEQTILVAEERGLPLPLLAAYGAGIQIHLENLAAYLAGRELAGASRWEELIPAYRALAPDAG
jgi:uncharacterized protein YndB with AHSA1/START domain